MPVGADALPLRAGHYGLFDFSGKTLALRTGRGEKEVEIFVAELAHSFDLQLIRELVHGARGDLTHSGMPGRCEPDSLFIR